MTNKPIKIKKDINTNLIETKMETSRTKWLKRDNSLTSRVKDYLLIKKSVRKCIKK